MGSGSVGTEKTYSFAVENEDGSYSLSSLPTDGVKVFEDDSQTPSFKVVTTQTKPCGKLTPFSHRSTYTSYELVIPEGSLAVNFDPSP